MKILLIAGHGDGDPGACALGYKEAELTREFVTDLVDKLSTYMDVTVFDTTKNMYKYLKEHMYNFELYDYVLEVHFNAAANDTEGNGKTTGAEIYVHPAEKYTSVEACVLKKLSALGFKNRGVKIRPDLQNINICKGAYGVSCALLEICFIDDADDMKIYHTKTSEVVSAVANGITDGFGIERKEDIPSAIVLESANDITWELNHAYFPIIEIDNFVKALDDAKKTNSPLYWGYYKLVNKR